MVRNRMLQPQFTGLDRGGRKTFLAEIVEQQGPDIFFDMTYITAGELQVSE